MAHVNLAARLKYALTAIALCRDKRRSKDPKFLRKGLHDVALFIE